MSIKKAIKVKIESVAEVLAAGLVMYYEQAPQERAMPYGTFERIGESQYGTNLVARESWTRELFEINLYHNDDEALELIRNAIIKALHGQGPVTWSTIFVHVALIEEARDLGTLEQDGAGTSDARHQLELRIKYNMP